MGEKRSPYTAGVALLPVELGGLFHGVGLFALSVIIATRLFPFAYTIVPWVWRRSRCCRCTWKIRVGGCTISRVPGRGDSCFNSRDIDSSDRPAPAPGCDGVVVVPAARGRHPLTSCLANSGCLGGQEACAGRPALMHCITSRTNRASENKMDSRASVFSRTPAPLSWGKITEDPTVFPQISPCHEMLRDALDTVCVWWTNAVTGLGRDRTTLRRDECNRKSFSRGILPCKEILLNCSNCSF